MIRLLGWFVLAALAALGLAWVLARAIDRHRARAAQRRKDRALDGVRRAYHDDMKARFNRYG